MTTLAALLEAGKTEEALALFVSQPSDAALLLNHARSWHAKGLLEEQRRACEAVLAQDKSNAEAWHLLGFHAQSHGDFAQAERYYSTALSYQNDFAFAQLALAQMQMLRSCFKQGRDLYEARFDAVTEKSGADWRGLPITRWRGEPLTGKSLYLWEEQGLGDIIMFASLLPYIMRQSSSRVMLGINAQLLLLFTRSFPEVVVEPIERISNHALGNVALHMYPQRHLLKGMDEKPLEAAYHYALRHGIADYAAPLGDLLVFGDITPAPSYLTPDPIRKNVLETLLRPLAQGQKIIGISWQTSNAREALRNIPLEVWLPLLARPDCFFVSLQHHFSREMLQAFCTEHDCAIWQHPEQDLTGNAEDIAALIASMDQVITADNSNVHLAGALGISTSLLLPKGHNFRWPEIADGKTLWYESVTTIRQHEIGIWEDVIKTAAEHIK